MFNLIVCCFQDAKLVEALWKVDLDSGSTAATGESHGASPYSNVDEGSPFLLFPGDEPPSRNYTLNSPPSSSNRRWCLPPLNFTSNDLSACSSSYPVNIRILYILCLEYLLAEKAYIFWVFGCWSLINLLKRKLTGILNITFITSPPNNLYIFI